ncbi:MAG: phosphate transport system regulatory protein PhoU [Chloroflexi bacterium]|nr:MAG: phosphate transport system regulatory protein PhoU [Chloroflexota bacterium]
MPRESFDRELQRLQDEVLALGSMVENAITEAVDTLKRRDVEGARRIIAQDRLINEKRFGIESKALALIATQQPAAIDLRTIAAVLDIASELERIGDYAKGIARINLMIGREPLLKPIIDVPAMADKTRDMLYQSLDAFVRRDVELAHAIPEEDDVVDTLYEQLYRNLIDYIIADQSNIEQANYLLWVAHNLERAADRVTNICERVIFTVTGKMVELDVKDSSLIGPS